MSMTSRELLAFANYIRERIGVSDSNEVPLHGILDAYGLTGADREEMIGELHKTGAIRNTNIDATIAVDKLPQPGQ
jgi:hypothetical protein